MSLSAPVSPGGRVSDLPTLDSVRSNSRGLPWVLVGKVTLLACNAGLMLALTYSVSLQTYGLFVTAVGAQILGSRLLLFGIDSGTVRLRSLNELSDRECIVDAGVLILRRRIFWFLLVSVITFVVLRFFDWRLLPLWWLLAVVLGSLGSCLVDYCYSVEQAVLHFRRAALFQSGMAGLRMIATLFVAQMFSGHSTLIFYVFACGSLLPGLFFAAAISRRSTTLDRSWVRVLSRHSAWQGAAEVLLVLWLYQGTFVLSATQEPSQRGVFSLALALGMGFLPVRLALFEHFLATAAHVSRDVIRGYLKTGLLIAVAMAAGCIPLGIVAGMLAQWLLLKPEFVQAIPAFYWVTGAILVRVVQAPLDAMCLYVLRPELHTVANAVLVVCVIFFASLLAPWGALGVAAGQFLGTAIAFAVLLLSIRATLHSRVEFGLLADPR